MSSYPTFMHLLPAPLSIHESLAGFYFTNPNWLLVPAVVLFDEDGIYIVEPAQAPRNSETYIFPQKTGKHAAHNTFLQLLQSGLASKLGLNARSVEFLPTALSRAEIHIPTCRTGGSKQTKCIPYFGARLKKGSVIALNREAVRAIHFIGSAEDFLKTLDTMSRRRCAKCAAMTDAVIALYQAGHLPSKDWAELEDIMPEAWVGAEVAA